MNKDLTVGDSGKVLWKFCIPLFASIIFQQLYNIADSLVAGKFIGEEALAAVGNSYEVTLIFIAFAFGCNIGCSVVTSKLFGAKNFSEMKTAVYTALISSAVLCAVLMSAGIILSDDLLLLIDTPNEILDESKVYLDIYIYGLPFVFFYNIANGIFTALGDTKTPFIFLMCSSIANIGADILFTTALRWLFPLAVAGVAWATFICQGISCTLALIFVFIRLNKIKCDTKPRAFSFALLRSITAIAVPSMLQQSFISVGNIIIQAIINSFGAGVVAGYSAAIKLNNLVITSLSTLANGISNFTAQNIGAKLFARVKEGFRAGLKIVFIICAPLTILYFFGGKYLLMIFMKEPSEEAIASGNAFLQIVAPFYMIAATKLVSDGVLRGSGRMKEFMIGTFTDLTLRVLLAYLLSKTALGWMGIWTAWPIGWVIATAISLLFYAKYYRDKEEKLTI